MFQLFCYANSTIDYIDLLTVLFRHFFHPLLFFNGAPASHLHNTLKARLVSFSFIFIVSTLLVLHSLTSPFFHVTEEMLKQHKIPSIFYTMRSSTAAIKTLFFLLVQFFKSSSFALGLFVTHLFPSTAATGVNLKKVMMSSRWCYYDCSY